MARKPPRGAALHGPVLSEEYFGTTKHFGHVKAITPEYNMASSAEREKAPIRMKAANMGKAFSAAHEGPREKTGKPEIHHILTPKGNVAYEVYKKHDEEKVLRNRKKDLQMKMWRETRISRPRKFNTRAMAPIHLREKVTPRVFSQHGKREAEQRRNQDLDRGR